MGNILSDTTLKTFYNYYERLNQSLWEVLFCTGSTTSANRIINAPSNPQLYEDKMYRVKVYTNGTNMFNEGTVKIYGRVRM